MKENKPNPTKPKRFRIAFSFAGEKRALVSAAAELLAQQFGKENILYDKYHEAEFARNDLSIYLPNLYNRETDLVVVVVCAHYDIKAWTGLEWLAIHDLLQQRLRDEVMLCRFEHAQVDGLFSGAGFVELDHKTPEEFVSLILERLARNEGLPRTHYTQPALPAGEAPPTTISNNLPRIQPFFGREAELAKIAEALHPENRGWGALIDGPGGMGKTTLAVRAAQLAPPADFDRIVFVSLKYRELDDDGLRDLSGFLISGLTELLNELARELEREDVLRVGEAEKPKMIIEALRNTRTLLVLDNLESLIKSERDTLFNFIKRLPAGCKAILTARGRIGSGAEELILQELSEAAALETLAELATHNPVLARTTVEERRQLYIQTTGKPLLLRWTAGQIGRGSCLTVQEAIAYLRSCPPNNDPLAFIFGDLVEDFSAAETHTLCALTYFNLPATPEHIAAIAEQPVAETGAALRSLANRSLAVPGEDLKTFTLVPLVADFLRVKKPELVKETGNRLEKLVYALVVENGYENHDRFPILEANWPALAAALPGFIAGENARLQTVCGALNHFLNFTGRWDEWLALVQDAERRALLAGDDEKAGWRAYQAGWVYYLRGEAEKVMEYADRAETHWLKAKAGVREQAVAIRLRGIGHQLAKNYSAAIADFQKTVGLRRSLGSETVDVAIGLNMLANAESENGDLDLAEQHFREALQIAKTVNYKEGIAYIPGNLAALALDREDWPAAEAQAREALVLSEKLGRKEMIAEDSRRLAKALARQGNKEEARPFAQRAVDIYRELKSRNLGEAEETLKECE